MYTFSAIICTCFNKISFLAKWQNGKMAKYYSAKDVIAEILDDDNEIFCKGSDDDFNGIDIGDIAYQCEVLANEVSHANYTYSVHYIYFMHNIATYTSYSFYNDNCNRMIAVIVIQMTLKMNWNWLKWK